jgi:r-opsin
MCELHGFVGMFSGFMSIWTMAAISSDRYNVIVHGMAHKPMTYKKALFTILLIDVFCLIWSLLPFFGWNRYVLEGNMAVCGSDSLR